jgi:hypothetical protein
VFDNRVVVVVEEVSVPFLDKKKMVFFFFRVFFYLQTV